MDSDGLAPKHDLGEWSDLDLPFLLGRASRRLDELVRGQLDEVYAVPADLEDVYILQRISGSSGASIAAVAEHLGIRAQPTSRRIARLARAGLVDHGPHPADARASLVGLTANGRAALDLAQQAIDDALHHLADELEWAAAQFGESGARVDGARRLTELTRDAKVIATGHDQRSWWRGTRGVAGPSAWTRRAAL